MLIGAGALVAVTRANPPANNLVELIAQARQQPGKLTLGHSGNGTILHLAGEQMLRQAGVQMLVVPYKGVSGVIPDVLGGTIDVAIFGPSSVLGLIRDGKLRALGVTGTGRISSLPDVPPIAESGVPGYNMEGWIALVGPADLPVAIANRLADEVTRIGTEPAFQSFATDAGMAIRPLRGEPLRQFFADEYARYGRLIAQAGLKAE